MKHCVNSFKRRKQIIMGAKVRSKYLNVAFPIWGRRCGSNDRANAVSTLQKLINYITAKKSTGARNQDFHNLSSPVVKRSPGQYA